MVLETRVVEVQALSVQTINQQAEVITLTCACQLAKGQSLKLYTDYQPASSLRRKLSPTLLGHAFPLLLLRTHPCH